MAILPAVKVVFKYRDAAFVKKLHQAEKIVDSVLLEPLGAGKNNRSLRSRLP